MCIRDRVVHDAHQVGKVSPEAVKPPDCEGVTSSQGFEAILQLGAVGVLSTSVFAVDSLAPMGCECINLRVCGLVFGRDTGIAYFHDANIPTKSIFATLFIR
mgnify:CR=1 FL=1